MGARKVGGVVGGMRDFWRGGYGAYDYYKQRNGSLLRAFSARELRRYYTTHLDMRCISLYIMQS